ncbi:fascin domain-containing protein [Streptomyces sp. NPDC085481]|uniref:fascin domain-containing protein n=1 Tax=Streptomyces sp. NPDC085481 TaxID=3365727 RepID=UPI0037CF6587
MRRPHIAFLTLILLLAGSSSFLTAPPAVAAADAPKSSAGQRWALKVRDGVAGASYLVAAELSDTLSEAQKGKLRARTPESSPIGTWETFTLHTVDDGATVSLRNERNGRYVATEINYPSPQTDMLRARSETIGTSSTAWEKFVLTADPKEPGTYDLWSVAAHAYVTAKFSLAGDPGLLLASATSAAGSWERVTLVPVPGSGEYGGHGEPPATTGSPAGAVRNVVSWNACSNNNADCSLEKAEVATVGETVAAQAQTAQADALFVQEFCEKSADPLETRLEQRTVGGLQDWDVRFTPVYRKVKDTGVLAQKHCANSKTGADRGAYGMAVALPGGNTWYRSWVLESRDTAEQRPLLCATVPSLGTAYCGGHFSAGITGDDLYQKDANDHPDGYYRNKQAQAAVATASMLRARGYQVVFGGDLNASPPDAEPGPGTVGPWVLEPLYSPSDGAGFEECDQSAHGGLRTGDATHVSATSRLKLDYVFGPPTADYSCTITDTRLSDHYLIRARVAFP